VHIVSARHIIPPVKISGFTFIRNRNALGYPFAPSIRSLLPLCKEIIVNVPRSTDDTLAADSERATGHLPMDDKLFIIALRCGRLANRLVLFANFIAFAEEHGHRVANVTFHSYAHLFETTRRDIYCRYPVVTRRSVFDLVPPAGGTIRKTRIFYHLTRAASVLNEKFPVFGRRVVTLRELPREDMTLLEGPVVQVRIADARIVLAYGWRFRAPACVVRHAEKIRAHFRPLEEHARASREAVERLRQKAGLVVGVHIRRGDYRDWRHGQCFFEPAQYAAWMRELAQQLPSRRVAFFVCSDEPRAAQEFPGLTVGLGAGSPVRDLFALAECDYILGPLGTFSQWASFYGNKPLFQFVNRYAHPDLAQFRVPDLSEIP